MQAAVSLISSGGRSSSSSASPAPHADLHNAAAFIDCEEIVIHSHGLEQGWFLLPFPLPPSSHTAGQSPGMVPQGSHPARWEGAPAESPLCALLLLEKSIRSL